MRSLGIDYSYPTDYEDQVACINIANASPKVKAVDAEISRLVSSWNPTGYYTLTDVEKILDVLATEAATAGDVLAKAPRSVRDAEQMIREAFNDLINKYQARAKLYEQDIATARAGGINFLDAPALKSFVISSMRAISDAYVTATVMYCRQSYAEVVLGKLHSAMARVGSVVWSVVGVAASAVKSAVKAADTALGLIGAIVKYAPVIGVAAIGYFIYSEYKKKRR